MADSIYDVGTIVFGATIGVMTVSAGVASLPPARNIKVFIGAAVIATAWLLVVALIKDTGSRLITSMLFFLDIGYAVIFYFLAKPAKAETSHAGFDSNWASYVVAVFVAVIFLEIGNVFYRFDGWYRVPVLSTFVIIAAILAFGFARGFGTRATVIFVACLSAITFAAVISYVRTVNFLTLVIILIISATAFRGVMINLKTWTARLRKPSKPRRQ